MMTKKQKEKGMEECLRAFKLAGMCNLCIAALRSNNVFCDRSVIRHPTCLEIVENFAEVVIEDLAKKQARKETNGNILEFKRRVSADARGD
jgi:hypothetical protein